MIFIADGDPAYAAALEKYFRLAGHDAIAYWDGQGALDALRASPPKLIILDLHLPGIDGMSLLHAIRKDATFRSVPVLIYARAEDGPLEQDAINAGAQDFLLKNVAGWDVLLRRAREFLGQGPPPPAPAPAEIDE
jgi:DNA-binding response OmpR family regulator